MAASVVVDPGMFMNEPMMPSMPMPTPRAARAMPIGSTIASSEPRATNRITTAAPRPIASWPCGCWSPPVTSPANAVLTPTSVMGASAVFT